MGFIETVPQPMTGKEPPVAFRILDFEGGADTTKSEESLVIVSVAPESNIHPLVFCTLLELKQAEAHLDLFKETGVERSFALLSNPKIPPFRS